MKNRWCRKILVVVVSFMMVLGTTFGISAAEQKEFSNDVTMIGLGIDNIQSNKIKRRYIPSCPDPSGIHLMKGRGPGWAYYGYAPSNDLRLKGQASQCANCHLVLITENKLFLNPSLPWGKYALWNPGYQVGNGVVMYTKSFGEINSKNDPFARGFVFN